MVSACINSSVAMSPEAFGAPAKIPGAYGWISPRVSFSGDFAGDESSAAAPRSPEKPDPDGSLKDLPDFEFRLDDPVAMLPADELISNGRLVPLQVAAAERREGGYGRRRRRRRRRRGSRRCSDPRPTRSRRGRPSARAGPAAAPPLAAAVRGGAEGRAEPDAAGRGGGGDAAPPPPSRGPSVDSPRLNAAGKVVFQSLERSSSSPSTFNGGPRVKHRGIERSYSANVRVAPVLNVPVCSLRGSGKGPSVFALGTLFSSSSLRREREASSSSSSSSSAVAMARGGSRSKMEKDKASGH
uniref:Uncharacterized protein n=1 Tax=Ananas comosus var. bracteatus TaxID=296719 RepID=A0A6V7QEA6_ANACO|nr:unnamed protein product [Ananas comosus var. bracteatus]